MLSVGQLTGEFVLFPVIPISIEMIPTRPRNIAAESTILDAVDSCSVMPSDDPTVNSAEIVSNMSDFGGSPGSRSNIVVVKINSEKMDIAITALALLIDADDMVRLQTTTLFLPSMVARRFSSDAATVLTLIPPAGDCEAPPIHISITTISIVTGENMVGLRDVNPELRGQVALNIDWHA